MFGIVLGTRIPRLNAHFQVWDLRNMRSPISAIRLNSPANRLAISHKYNLIGIPLDNRHVCAYDLHGQRVARMPRANGRVRTFGRPRTLRKYGNLEPSSHGLLRGLDGQSNDQPSHVQLRQDHHRMEGAHTERQGIKLIPLVCSAHIPTLYLRFRHFRLAAYTQSICVCSATSSAA